MAYYPDFPTVDDAGQGFAGFSPQQMMLLGLSQGLLQAGQPTSRPMGLGGALGSGIQGALSGANMAQSQINQSIKNKQAQQMIDLEEKKTTQAQQAIDREEARQRLLAPIMERFMNAQQAQNPMSPQSINPSVMAGSGTTMPAAPQAGAFPMSPNEIAALKLGGGPDLLPNYQATRPDLSIQNGFLVDKHGGIVGSTPQTNQQGFSTITVQDPSAPGGYRVMQVPGGSAAFGLQQQIQDASKAMYANPIKVDPTSPNASPTLQNPYNLAVKAGAPNVLSVGGGAGTPSGLSPAQEASQAANVEQQKDVARNNAKIYNDLQNASMQNPAKKAKFERIGTLLGDFEGGKLSGVGLDIAKLGNSLGIKIDDKLPNKEAAVALTNEVALELRSTGAGNGMPGSMSDSDREFLKQMAPQMAQTAEGRRTIIDSRVKVLERENKVADMARQYRKKHGGLDEDFFTQLQGWSNRNPIFGTR